MMDNINDNFTLSDVINGPLLAAAFATEMIGGLITNSLVLILTASHLKTWKQPTTIFLSNMLLNNLVIGICIIPFAIITAAVGEWIFGRTEKEKETVCQVVGCIFTFTILTATESLVLLSFDRFFFITKSFQYNKYMTVNKALVIVSLSWALAVFLSILPFLGFGVHEFLSGVGLCVAGWNGQTAYAIVSFLVLCIFIGSIIVTSIWTLCFTRKHIKKTAIRTSIGAERSNHTQERKVIGVFGMLIIVHLLCYAPIISFGLVESFINVLTPTAYAVAVFILFLLITLIPLVQSFFRSDIRTAIVKGSMTVIAFTKRCRTTPHQISTVEMIRPSTPITSSSSI
ncbi:PREDICTED: trace amine-associated receptor 13c-like [Amphimedon queenslandica]|uniref:G-protein coupled receptors family 1 profile domain-containing protein n=2 Tax=Amphimedon queenslandica TaxID=400682 RepID=A0AAN0IR13_AMPQE|nr:PREDICTED: trace amine-associated receptor 13c-like [Amphimedon queenslandica]|eukprot:XP_011407162.2 PREDICTED: trace amine-associated receptor 13c-like [Amphimedon queenslandica]